VAAIEENENDYLAELQRQLEMEKNLHLVQEEQINSLKNKCDHMSNEKEEFEKEIEALRFELIMRAKEIKDNSHKVVVS
jgi:hypothetical protein